MRRILKSELDKFYTKPDLSKYLISKINLEDYDLVIDPSCGDGAFYLNIDHKNKIGIDIDPQIIDVQKSDFLKWNYRQITSSSDKVLVLSNPPFGKGGSLAHKFIKKCSAFSDTIAFILPLSFCKESQKNKIPQYFHLDYEEILPENSFLLNDKEYHVKCVFQIWKKKSTKRLKVQTENPIVFEYTKNKTIADLSIRRVGFFAGKASLDCNKSEQSHYFIILDDKSKVKLVIEKLNEIEWDDFTVGPRSISKLELNSVLNKIYLPSLSHISSQ
jgi:hypothetical protein